MASSIDNADVSPSPSPELESKLEAANLAFGHAKEAILSAYHQALSEGFSPFQAKELLFTKIKSVSQRTIYLYLPGEAKDKEKQGIAKRSLQSCSDTIDKKNQTANKQKTRNLESRENQSLDKVILDTKLADIIYDCVRSDKSNGYPYRFLLTHDGRNVSSVEDYESKDVSPASNRDESDSKSKDALMYPGHSDVKQENNEINSPTIESPNCKLHIQKIQELEEALKKSSGPTTADIRLAAAGQDKKEFVIPVDIDEIQHEIQRLQHTGDLSNIIRVTAYIEIETGRTISVYYGEPYDNT